MNHFINERSFCDYVIRFHVIASFSPRKLMDAHIGDGGAIPRVPEGSGSASSFCDRVAGSRMTLRMFLVYFERREDRIGRVFQQPLPPPSPAPPASTKVSANYILSRVARERVVIAN